MALRNKTTKKTTNVEKIGREYKLISPEVSGLLISQLAHELKNYNLYNSFANYFGIEGIDDLEKYFRKRAEEERDHHDWILKYLSEADCRVIYPEIEKNSEQEVEDCITPFKDTIIREIETTQLLYNIHQVAMAQGDLMTCQWLLNGLIEEQIEEENTSRMALAIMELDSDILVKADRVLCLLNK